MRNYVRFALDLAWVASSAYLALLVRDNFVPSVSRFQTIVPYALISVAAAAAVFSVGGLHRTMWRYTSLLDVLHLMGAVTIALLLALLASFAFNRLEDIARAVPVIQWFVLVAALIGTRTAVRLWRERADRSAHPPIKGAQPQYVLLIGIGDLTELYLASMAEFRPDGLTVLGILSRGRALRGRLMRQQKVLGAPEDLRGVLAELELHGVTVDRIVIAQRFERLSKTAQEELLEVERTTSIKIEWLLESLGWRGTEPSARTNSNVPSKTVSPPFSVDSSKPLLYRTKRLIDLVSVVGIALTLSPLLVLLTLVVAIDVGLPVVFWQQRPGRYGRPFKLFKFRTMRPAHDMVGNRVPDDLRSSNVGSFLRRSRLDELPQLYNILMGEMSLVGPRPLLPLDQPESQSLRLLARPGLTGWAQVNGGRKISPQDKAALDIWYIENASLWLDITILLRTIAIMIFGDRVNGMAVRSAHAGLEEIKTKPTVEAARCGQEAI